MAKLACTPGSSVVWYTSNKEASVSEETFLDTSEPKIVAIPFAFLLAKASAYMRHSAIQSGLESEAS